MEYYSVIKTNYQAIKNTWITLKYILLSERKQFIQGTYYIVSII